MTKTVTMCSWPLRMAALTFLTLSAATSTPAAPLEAYGKLPFIEDVALSPDGKMLAYAITDGEARKIAIKALDSGTTVSTIGAGTGKIRSIQWAGSDHLLITASSTSHITGVYSERQEWWVAFDYNIARKTITGLLSKTNRTSLDFDTLGVIDGTPQIRFIDGHPFAFVAGTVFVEGFQEEVGQMGLFKVDLDHQDVSTVVSQGFPHTERYVVDAKGRPLAESEFDAREGRWTLRLWDGAWHVVDQRSTSIGRPSLQGLGRDGLSIAVAGRADRPGDLEELSPDGLTWSAPFAAPTDLIWDPETDRLIGGAALAGDALHYTFFEPKDAAAWKVLKAAFGDIPFSLNSFSEDRKRFVVRMDSPTDGPSYLMVNLTTQAATPLGEDYKDLTADDIGPKTAVTFKAGDGLVLTGYLTLPKGKVGRDLPLVVFPHGGPAARDEPGFDWWAQAMASRGYAVLQVNYRGSEGFGWDFQSAGFGQWGRKMQTDLSDGVRYLAAQGIIDAKRVCIVGASYGGYAALAGATLDRGVYRCAVSVAGPSDLAAMIADERSEAGEQGIGVERYWLRYMGAKESLAEISPAQQAAKVAIPVLLIHGKDDTIVPFEQSQIMADALRKAGKPVDFVTLNKEDHWLSRGATRLQMLQAVVAFLEKNDPAN